MRAPPFNPARNTSDAAREFRSEVRRQPPPLPDSPMWRDRSARPIRVADTAKPAPDVSLIQASSITPEAIKWLWPGWLAGGKMHILGGAPGTGKTTIAVRLAATISCGGTWPDGTRALAGNVIVWSGEDDPGDTLVPRLIAAGADMRRVYFVSDVIEDGKKRAFDPATDLDALRTAISRAGGASLIAVDPIVSAVAGDSHKNAEVRRALQPLCDMAATIGAAIVGVTHFSKGTSGRDVTERITGSLAFAALSRVVLIAAKKPSESDDDPPTRIFMRAKSNIGRDDGGYEYSLIERELDGYPGVEASLVEWGAPIEGNARDVLQEAETVAQPDGGAVAKARDFLQALLADGPMSADAVRTNGEGSGLSWAAIRRGKKAAGVTVKRAGFGGDGQWLWSLETS